MPYFETLLVQIQEKVKFLQKLGCHFLDKKKKNAILFKKLAEN